MPEASRQKTKTKVFFHLQEEPRAEKSLETESTMVGARGKFYTVYLAAIKNNKFYYNNKKMRVGCCHCSKASHSSLTPKEWSPE